MSEKEPFFLDPLAGERDYPEEPAFTEYISALPQDEELVFASGYTEFTPTSLLVGGRYDFNLTFFPQEKSLEPGAIVKFSVPRSWTQPQGEEGTPGYVEAERSADAGLETWFTHNENVQWWICVRVLEEREPAEGFIEVSYSGVTVQRFPQKEFKNWRNAMRTVVQYKGEGGYAVVPAERTEKPTVTAAPASKLNIATPSVMGENEGAIEVKFSLLDYCDNWARPFQDGEIFVASPDSPFSPLKRGELTSEDHNSGKMTVEIPPSLKNMDHFRLAVSDRKDRLWGESPPIVNDNKGERLNVYFGDIHAKTINSDGLRTPQEYFEHARDVALNDFAAIADHNHAEASWIEGPFVEEMTDEAFRENLEACREFNEPGEFVTLEGFEQNYIEGYPGHRNIYFRDNCPGLFRGDTLEELYDYLKAHKALVIPHHTVIWNTRVHLDNTEFSRLIEMYSMHCSSEMKGSPLNNYPNSPAKAETGQSAREVLNQGYRVGFIAASDNHNGAPGLSAKPSRFTNLTYSGGLAAVFAPELTREAIFDGLYDRRCYATTGERIYLNFRVNGEPMGSEIEAKRGEKLHYEITVGGTADIAKIELIKSNGSELLADYEESTYRELEGETKIPSSEDWFYVRVTQADRHMAWSSPVWVDLI